MLDASIKSNYCGDVLNQMRHTHIIVMRIESTIYSKIYIQTSLIINKSIRNSAHINVNDFFVRYLGCVCVCVYARVRPPIFHSIHSFFFFCQSQEGTMFKQEKRDKKRIQRQMNYESVGKKNIKKGTV